MAIGQEEWEANIQLLGQEELEDWRIDGLVLAGKWASQVQQRHWPLSVD